MKRERVLAITGVMLLAASVVRAGTLTTVDARMHSGALVAVETPGEVVWRSADGTRAVFPADEVDRIDLAAVRGWADGSPAWLITAGGMRLPGRPVSTEQGQLTWEDRKRVGEGKRGDVGGRRIIKKKKTEVRTART